MQHYKKTKFLLLILCCISMILCGCSTAVQSTAANNHIKNSNEAFDALTHEIFVNEANSDTLTLNYTLKDPSAYGIESDTITWGDVPVTTDDFSRCQTQTKHYLERLSTISDISSERSLTYDIVKYYLEMDLESYDYIYFSNNFAPMLGVQSQLPLVMCEYNFDTTEDVDEYIALLNTVDTYINQLIAFENEKAAAGYGMCRSALEEAINDCRSFCETVDTNMLIEVFPNKLETLNLSPDEKNTYIQANKNAILNHVIPAYKNIISALTTQIEKAPEDGSLCSYKNGSDYYIYLLKSSVGTDKTPEELIEITEKNLKSSTKAISMLYMRNQSIFDTIENIQFSMDDPSQIIEHFKSTLLSDQFPNAPKADYTLKNVHESMKDSLSPAMYFIPRIDDAMDNQIYLNIGGNNSGNALMPTLAHEGYPGHMYQTTYFFNTNPDPIRTIFSNNGYIEGWASYVEDLSYDYCGFPEDVADFLRITNHSMTLNLYCRLDLGIHYEGWHLEDLQDFLNHYLTLDSETIEDIYNAILYNPTNYLIYGIGMEEIKELKNNMEENLGTDFNLKDFHKQLLDIGPAPFSIIEKYMPDASITDQTEAKSAA